MDWFFFLYQVRTYHPDALTRKPKCHPWLSLLHFPSQSSPSVSPITSQVDSESVHFPPSAPLSHLCKPPSLLLVWSQQPHLVPFSSWPLSYGHTAAAAAKSLQPSAFLAKVVRACHFLGLEYTPPPAINLVSSYTLQFSLNNSSSKQSALTTLMST